MLRKGVEKREPFYTDCWWECKLITATMENSTEGPYKTRNESIT